MADLLPRSDVALPDGRRLSLYGAGGQFVWSSQPSLEPPPELQQRLDDLTDEWVLVAPSRNHRPASSGLCPFCPGGDEIPGQYEAAVFDNRFPALTAVPPPVGADGHVSAALGHCEVILYTSRHEGSIRTLGPAELSRVVAIWADRTAEHWANPRHAFVMAFENRGAEVGATIPHPHGQLYAFDRLPPRIALRVAALTAHRRGGGGCLHCAVVGTADGSDRVVFESPSFSVAVPFAPAWPFEIHVRSRRHGLGRLAQLDPEEGAELARCIREVVRAYDGLFGIELPYMMVALEAPRDVDDWHLGFEFYPVQRNEREIKWRASVETATGVVINDKVPEEAAAELRRSVLPEEVPWELVPLPRIVPAGPDRVLASPASRTVAAEAGADAASKIERS